MVCSLSHVFHVHHDQLCVIVIIMEEPGIRELFPFVLFAVVVGGFNIHGGPCIEGVKASS